MRVMVELSAEELAQRAFDLNLISERQLKEIWAQVGSRQISLEDLKQLLLRREFLTNFQVERLLRGERYGYFYGNYKVLYLIGTGTFARVYRANHKETGDMMAVKVLRTRYLDDSEQTDRFYREGMLGASLRHPNIVPIYEVVSQGREHYLVMGFIEGRNLREFNKLRPKFEPAEALRIMTDVAAGLSYAYEKGVCHRDLKMSNIFISSRGQAKVLDFGLAAGDKNSSDEALANMENPRTIDYAGLERATGVRKDDPRSDIYFLGGIFYHLLTGKPPLTETKDRLQRLSRSRFLDVVPIARVDANLPKALVMIVNKAMELDPAKRYQSPGELLGDLQTAASRLSEIYSPDDQTASSSSLRLSSGPAPPQRTLMFVEANVDLQDVFRERLKTSGYRIMVTRDPDFALQRFSEGVKIDCVVFSSGGLGEVALEAFNRLAMDSTTQQTPALLLLSEQHVALKERAQLSKSRVCLTMPIRLRELRETLAKLVNPQPAASETPGS